MDRVFKVVKSWRSLRYFLLFIVMLWAIFATVLYLITGAERTHILKAAQEKQKNIIEKNLATFNKSFTHAQQDVLYLTKLAEVRDYATNHSPTTVKKLELGLGGFLETHSDYDHIRFVDVNGYEVVRINQTSNGIYYVPKAELQYKGDTSYFVDSKNLARGKVYISEFDLNREHGVIDPALKTVIRLITNVFNEQGIKVGSIIANLRGNEIFEKIGENTISKGMQTSFFRVGEQAGFLRIDSHDEFSGSMASLISIIQQSDERWGSHVLNGYLYTYNLFSPRNLSSSSIDIVHSQNLTTEFPWLSVVKISEEELSDKFFINQVNPWLFWGFLTIFLMALSYLFAHLRSSKASFERMLERQVSLFDGFFKNTPSAYVIKDLDNRIVYFNGVASGLFGDKKDISGSNFSDLGVVKAEQFSEVEGRVVSNKQTNIFETKINNTHLHVTIFPILNNKNEIILIGIIAADQSTSLKRSEHYLRKNTHLLEVIGHAQNLFMNSDSRESSFDYLLNSIMSLTTSDRGLIGEIYSKYKGLLGIRVDAVCNIGLQLNTQDPYKSVLEALDDPLGVDSLFDEVILHQKAVIINDMKLDSERAINSEAMDAFTSFLGIPIFYQNTCIGVIAVANSEERYDYAVLEYISPLLELYGQMLHITQVQREKQLIAKQLSQKEYWLSMVIDTSPDGVILVNEQGEIILANQTVSNLLGYDADELISKDFEMLIPEFYRMRHKKYFQQYMKGEYTELNISGRAVQVMSKSGDFISVEIRLSPIVEEDDGHYTVCSIRDIRERLETEKQLRQSHKMDAIGQLTGGIAHDFNNLLGIIQGNLDLAGLSIEDGDTKAALDDISKAQDALIRSAKLIQRLLAFARKQPLTPELISLEETINGALSLFEHALGSKIKLNTFYELELDMVKIDQQQFENALINLAVNAHDAMEDGGEFSIRVFHQVVNKKMNSVGGDEIEHGHYVCVEVEDTGSGLDEEQKCRIFEPFYTSKVVGKGTGLGLAMVYGFIRQSKGYIQVESQPNKGTCFKLYLPVSNEEKQVNAISDSPLAITNQVIKLLVVDDEPSLLESSSKLLENAGYKVVKASSAEQALELLRNEPFDLLFTDVVMQGKLNGVDLIMQAKKQYPDLVFVVGTGYSERLLEDVEFQWLRKFLILKPYSEAKLLKVIRHSLENKQH